MYLQEDSPVNHTQSQESVLVRPMKDTSFLKCYELLKRSSQHSSWAKTFVGLLVGMEDWSSMRCALTWKAKDMKYSRLLFQLQASTPRTEGTEFGLLLTPTTREEVQDLGKFKDRMEKYPNGTTMPNLATQVVSLLPTPSAYDWNTARKEETFLAAKARHKAKGVNLQNPLKQMAKLGMLPTPKAQESRGNASRDRGKFNLTDEIAKIYEPSSKTSQLNPLFVEEMMGFPENWTLLPFLSGEWNQ